MSKIAIIGDLHIGARNDSAIFADYFKKFFEKVFFPYLRKHKIDTVIQLGDTLDRRKYINFQTAQYLDAIWFRFFEQHGIKLITVLGNHDIYFRNSVEVSGLKQMEAKYGNVQIIHEAARIQHGDTALYFFPWFCSDTESKIAESLTESQNETCGKKVLFGHLELAGFPMYRGIPSEHGTMELSALSGFDLIVSGHYHTHSEDGNVVYLGTPYEITWGDFGDKKVFAILDTETLALEYVQNPYRMFHKVYFANDSIKTVDFDEMKGGYIKIILTGDFTNTNLEKFVEALEVRSQPSNIQIIDQRDILENIADINVEIDDPLTVLGRSLEATITDPDILTIAIAEAQAIYNEALTVGGED